jgi:cellulose synthase/poly-beta-1,6-N-acetylglucosamine synthase-like glycosyltransferase
MSIIVWISLLALLHAYVFYPLLLKLLARKRKAHQVLFDDHGQWPDVHVLMSLYNEEQVIVEKLGSLLEQDYAGQIHIWIGSDASMDQTNEIVQQYAQQHPGIHFFPFDDRQGKPGVINTLYEKISEKYSLEDALFLITDANVFLVPGVVRLLAGHFKDPAIGLVDARMVHTGMKEEGISKAEDQYISMEVWIKYWEGVLWGKMIGPFGGCYMLRAKYFRKVPSNFLVDDFYIAMKVFEQGGKAINELKAVCYEAVSHDIAVEYRRKKRISAGNYQNLLAFRSLWWPPVKTLNFAFFSHKVLRWWGPFFLILLLLGSGLLSISGSAFYQLLFFLLVICLIVVPLFDWILSRFHINWTPLRGIRYFVLMNLALLAGFWKFLKGIKTNVWQPTKRHG